MEAELLQFQNKGFGVSIYISRPYYILTLYKTKQPCSFYNYFINWDSKIWTDHILLDNVGKDCLLCWIVVDKLDRTFPTMSPSVQ